MAVKLLASCIFGIGATVVVATLPAKAQPAGEDFSKPASVQIGGRTASLETIKRNALAIKSAHLNCEELKCVKFPCEEKGALLQDLVDAEAVLNEYLKAMIAQLGDANVHHANYVSLTDISGASQYNAESAIHLHQTLHDIGSALLDLASLLDFTKSDANINDVLEMAKDAESLFNTLKGNLGKVFETIDSIPDANVAGSLEPGVVEVMTAYGVIQPGETQADLKENINDYASHVSDGVSIAKELYEAAKTAKAAKEALDSAKTVAEQVKATSDAAKTAKNMTEIRKGLGKVIGRYLKGVSNDVMKGRKAHLSEITEALSAEVGMSMASYSQWQSINVEKLAAESALQSVREARAALEACLAAHCGVFTLQPPARFDFFDKRRGKYSWGEALQALGPQVDKIAGSLAPGTLVKDTHCPPPDNFIPHTPIPDGTYGFGTPLLPETQQISAKCPACASIANQINILRTSLAYLDSVINRQEADLAAAADLELERNKLITHASSINKTINETVAREGASPVGAAGIKLASQRAEMRELTAKSVALRQEAERLRDGAKDLDKNKATRKERQNRAHLLEAELVRCEIDECRNPEERARNDSFRRLAEAFSEDEEPEPEPTPVSPPVGTTFGIDPNAIWLGGSAGVCRFSQSTTVSVNQTVGGVSNPLSTSNDFDGTNGCGGLSLGVPIIPGTTLLFDFGQMRTSGSQTFIFDQDVFAANVFGSGDRQITIERGDTTYFGAGIEQQIDQAWLDFLLGGPNALPPLFGGIQTSVFAIGGVAVQDTTIRDVFDQNGNVTTSHHSETQQSFFTEFGAKISAPTTIFDIPVIVGAKAGGGFMFNSGGTNLSRNDAFGNPLTVNVDNSDTSFGYFLFDVKVPLSFD